MKKIISKIALALSFCLLLTACGGKTGQNDEGKAEFNVPSNIISEEEYHAQLEALLKTENLGKADEAFMNKISGLTASLKDRIVYNTDDAKPGSGKTYYVSENGNDSNDGLSPEKAFKTPDKVSALKLNEGDTVLFERGYTYRGYIAARSGVTYSAYGEGHKPVIAAAQTDLSNDAVWEPTSTKYVYKLSKKLAQKDVGLLVIYDKEGNDFAANKVMKPSKLKKNYDFVYAGPTVEEGSVDMSIYMYYDGGNPGEVFEKIEIPMHTSVFVPFEGIHDVTINNLSLMYGTGPFWPAKSKNITVSYCVIGWSGGFADARGSVRYHGGGGAWHSCDNFVWDHCYIYEQYDSGVSPQFLGNDSEPSIFKDFITKNCVFEACEWTLEYYTDQDSTLENRFENLYFGYNICIRGGDGFGTKPSSSAYVKSWGHENTCFNSAIEYNIFDRAAAETLEVIGYEQLASGNKLSYDHIPKLRGNIYIQKENKKFANINDTSYKFTKGDLASYIAGGFDTGSLFMFAE